jgi:PAS domain S-box-containing protein
MISTRKFLISFFLGLAGFGGALYSLKYSNPPFSLTITWSYFLPLLAGMAYGPFYGLIAGTLGLGAFFPFLIYPNNGWACLVNSLPYLLWFPWHGYFEDLRRKKPAFWNHPFFVYWPFAVFYILLMRIFFPIAFSFNPPFWNPQAELSMPVSILDGVITKGTLTMFLVVIFNVYLLKIPGVRKLLNLEIKKESHNNTWIALGSLLCSVVLWFVLIIFNRIFIDKTFPQGLFQTTEPHEILTLVVFLSAGFFMGAIVCQYVESRLKAEGELSISRENYRQIFEQAADGIFISDVQGNYIDVNDSGCKLVGYTRSEVLHLNMHSLVMPAEQDNVSERIMELMAGDTIVFERHMRHKNGSPIAVEIKAQRLMDGRLQGVVRDISQRTRAEASLRESESRYQMFFEHSAVPIWEEDFSAVKAFFDQLRQAGVQDFRNYFENHLEDVALCGTLVKILDINQNSLEFFQVSSKKEIIRNLPAYFTETSWPVFKEEMIALADGQTQFQSEIPIRMLNGDIRTLLLALSVAPTYRDTLARVLVSFIDISERKRVEEIIRQSSETAQAILNAATESVFLMAVDGTVIAANETTAVRLGTRGADLVGMNIYKLLPPEVAEARKKQVETVVQHGKPVRFEDERYGVWIENSIYPIFDTDGQVRRVAIYGRDVTEQKKAEEKIQTAQIKLQELLAEAERSRRALLGLVEDQKEAEEKIRQFNSELEQRVQDRTAQLEAANHELEAFAYSVSHDLRAPLRALDGFSEILMADYPDRLDEQGKHYLTRIQGASRRMGQLIEDLLNLSRITRREINLSRMDLSLIAQQIADELQAQSPERQVQFEITPNLMVRADANLMKIALENLLRNAFKFTNKREAAHIQFGMLEQPGASVYFVRDDGAGFDMAFVDKLFLPFQRLHGALEYPGTGIGLTIVQRVITRHGGRIWAEAVENQGATFYFTLGSV